MGCGQSHAVNSVKALENFDFQKNEKIEVEKIVRATFFNPRRKNFPSKLPGQALFSQSETPDWILEKLNKDMPKSLGKANTSNTMLHDSSKLNPTSKITAE